MNNFDISDELKEDIIRDFEQLKEFMGMVDEKLPIINFVTVDLTSAEFKLGKCFFDIVKVSFKELLCISKGIINIYPKTIFDACKRLLKSFATDTKKISLLAYHLVRYVAIHELVHHLQMKDGMTIENGETEETIENACCDTTKDYIHYYHRTNNIMRELMELDRCRLNDEYGYVSEELSNRTKQEILKRISKILDTEILKMEEIENGYNNSKTI